LGFVNPILVDVVVPLEEDEKLVCVATAVNNEMKREREKR
jgi:hypothetical protein